MVLPGAISARWCEHTPSGTGCRQLAVVLVTDMVGFTAYVCQDHWHHLHRASRGQIRAVQILTRQTRAADHLSGDGGSS